MRSSDLSTSEGKSPGNAQRRTTTYRAGRPPVDLHGKIVLLVDDGIATGSTVFAILNWLTKQNVKEIILAIPVMPASIFELMKKNVTSIVSLEVPDEFAAVGQFYKSFDQVSDEEVIKIFKEYRN